MKMQDHGGAVGYEAEQLRGHGHGLDHDHDHDHEGLPSSFPYASMADDDTKSDTALSRGQLSGRGSSSGRVTESARMTLSGRLTSSSLRRLPTQSLRGRVFYGWLWKKGASFKTWKKRFFLLHGCTLTYYTQCCVISSKELGMRCLDIPAKGGLRVAEAELTDETQFGIRITSSSGRVLFTQAGSHGPRLEWLRALHEASRRNIADALTRYTTMSDSRSSASSIEWVKTNVSAFTNSQTSHLHSSRSTCSEEDVDSSDLAAWLHVRSSRTMGSFKKRYVTLRSGHLTIMAECRPRLPQDVVHEVITVSAWSGHKYGFHLQLDRHKELFGHADSVTQAQQWIDALQNSL